MYYPYLRGKQEEILAIRQLAGLLAQLGNVCPVIEPVKRDGLDVFVRRLTEIARHGFPVAIIENPTKGDLRHDASVIRSELLEGALGSFGNVIPSLLVGPSTTTSVIVDFCDRWPGRTLALIHAGAASPAGSLAAALGGNVRFQMFRRDRTSREYRTTFSRGDSVVLIDGFTRMPRNEDYPAREFFSDVLRTHRGDGFSGFGDYLIVGDHYAPSGGRALAVAIHWTNLEDGDLWVYHFISDRTEGRGQDTAGKFAEALTKLCEFIRSGQNTLMSQGARAFLELERTESFPGLGVVKRLSMMHHIELIAQSLGHG